MKSKKLEHENSIIKNQKGFTLLEMLMVIFVIALLLLLTIPNITKHKDSTENRTCEGYADMAQTQATAYEIAEGEAPNSIDDLVSKKYIPSATCENGVPLKMNGRGEISVEIDEQK